MDSSGIQNINRSSGVFTKMQMKQTDAKKKAGPGQKRAIVNHSCERVEFFGSNVKWDKKDGLKKRNKSFTMNMGGV